MPESHDPFEALHGSVHGTPPSPSEIRRRGDRRRRRTTTLVPAGAATAAILAIAIPFAVFGGHGDTNAPVASTTPSVPSSTGSATTPSVPASTGPKPTGTLGPTGYRSLQLGMSYADARATGLLTHNPELAFWWQVSGHPEAAVCLTKAGGLMAIFGDETMATPEGIHLGSTLAEVKAAYPDLKRAIDFYYVPLSASTRYEFLIDYAKKINEWNLSTTDQTCFN